MPKDKEKKGGKKTSAKVKPKGKMMVGGKMMSEKEMRKMMT